MSESAPQAEGEPTQEGVPDAPTPKDLPPPATKPPQETDEKRNAAQALLHSFMKKINSGGPAKRGREDGGNPDTGMEGLHPSRRRRILENMGGVPDQPPHHDGLQQPGGAPTNPHVVAGAGKYNSSKVEIPPAMFSPPPWSGKPSKKYVFEVHFGAQEIVNRIPIWTHRQPTLVVGRSPDNNIVVNHALVSRRHAILLFHESDGEPMLYDLGSTHGTYLNDMTGQIPENDGLLPRKQFVKLKAGWRIMFGKCAYQYSLVEEGSNPEWRAPTGVPDSEQSPRGHQEGHHQKGRPSIRQQAPPPNMPNHHAPELRGVARFMANSKQAKNLKETLN